MGPLTYCAAILRLPAARCCLALSAWFLVQVPAGLSLAEPGAIGSLAAQTPPQDRRDSRRASRGAADEFRTEVPRTPYDIVLGRPTDTSVTASILAYAAVEGHFEFGARPGEYPGRTDTVRLAAGTPREVELDGLEPDTRYFYRWLGRASRADPLEASREHSFHTQRASGAGFVFTVQADSHLDARTDTRLYEASLRGAKSAGPDFHVDLGDTFMTDKRRSDYTEALQQYLAQRYYFGLIGADVPVFLVSGNHDGEGLRRGAMGRWARAQREAFFATPSDGRAGQGNYYSWEWGDALFVALDPFWATGRGRGDFWARTLGEEQYRWLAATLRASEARFKFVFVHHLVGGTNQASRGGAAAARLFEWGGRGLDGADEFDERRPGWGLPIHRLLVETGVSVVFHGHDHLFAREELDGVVYLLVPQPGLEHHGIPRDSAPVYEGAELVGGPGYLRVSVAPDSTLLELVRPRLAADAPADGTVASAFRVRPGPAGEAQ